MCTPTPHEGLGLLPIGIGGGSCAPPPPAAPPPPPPNPKFFFGGGGGAAFFPLALIGAAATVPDSCCPCTGPGACCPDCCPPIIPPTLFEIPYLLLNRFAVPAAEATCAPCRSRKLLAVEAVARASERETEEGSFWNDCAVLKASCFCFQVVPPPGFWGCCGCEAVLELLVVMREKRDWSSPS